MVFSKNPYLFGPLSGAVPAIASPTAIPGNSGTTGGSRHVRGSGEQERPQNH